MSTKPLVLPENLVKPFFEQKWEISKVKEIKSVYWRNNPGALFFIKKIQQNNDTPRGRKTILDLGCGDGRFSIQFARADFYTTGVDFSKQAILRLKNRSEKLGLEHLINGVVADVRNFKTETKKFNGVSCANTLHYFDDQELKSIIDNMKNMTKTSGLNYIAFECEIKMSLPDGRQFVFENQPYRTINSIKRLLKKNYSGWKVVYQNVTANKIKASLPPLLQDYFSTKSSHYKRSFKVFDFVVINK